MADSLASSHDALDETLGRLSKKPGVKATIVLDRASGAIVKTSGQVSALRSSRSEAATSFSTDSSTAQEGESPGAEGFATMVWNLVNASGALVQELDTEDEIKLLRLRTRKQELVIVPDAKWVLIAIHDTPPA